MEINNQTAQQTASASTSSNSITSYAFHVMFGAALTFGAVVGTGAGTSSSSYINISSYPTATKLASKPVGARKKKESVYEQQDFAYNVESHSNDQISLFTTNSDHMNTLLDKVSMFAGLEDDWDGYGGVAPYHRTLSNTVNFLKTIPTAFTKSLSEDNLNPTSYGTITVEWKAQSNNFFTVEIGDDQIAYFFRVNDFKGSSGKNIDIQDIDYSSIINVLSRLSSSSQA
jgi:hypothetical protein